MTSAISWTSAAASRAATCAFNLIRPSSRMRGGEEQHELPDGTVIHADFPPR
jgi:hypothetical protein